MGDSNPQSTALDSWGEYANHYTFDAVIFKNIYVFLFYCRLLLFILLFGMVSQKSDTHLWIFISGGQVAVDSADFDLTLLYKLIRNHVTGIPAPTRGWGIQPLPTHLNETDDIERIRYLRNELGQNSKLEICDTDFSTHWTDLSQVK